MLSAAAAENKAPPPKDVPVTPVPAPAPPKEEIAPVAREACAALFPRATVLKAERRTHVKAVYLPSALSFVPFPTDDVYFEFTLKDDLNKKFKARFDAKGQIDTIEKHKLPADQLPKGVLSALNEKSNGHADWTEPAELRIDSGWSRPLYKVSCKNGAKKTVRVEVHEDGSPPDQ